MTEAPIGFESDLFAAIKQEGSGADTGWFVPTNVRTLLQGDVLYLRCAGSFVLEQINKPEILARVAEKAGGILKRPVRVAAVNQADKITRGKMSALLKFGSENPEIVKIKS